MEQKQKTDELKNIEEKVKASTTLKEKLGVSLSGILKK
jgi:hypothetical protein